MSIQNSGVMAVMMDEGLVRVSHCVVCRRSLIQKMHVCVHVSAARSNRRAVLGPGKLRKDLHFGYLSKYTPSKLCQDNSNTAWVVDYLTTGTS